MELFSFINVVNLMSVIYSSMIFGGELLRKAMRFVEKRKS